MKIATTLKSQWFWYSMLCVGCWSSWAILQKMSSEELPAGTVLFLFTFGSIPVAFALLVARRFHLEKNPVGIVYSVLMGILANVGNPALTAAYRTGGSTSVITAATAMYPMLTVVLGNFDFA
jgi:drug/metabolite transporter (DMT)-like permease